METAWLENARSLSLHQLRAETSLFFSVIQRPHQNLTGLPTPPFVLIF